MGSIFEDEEIREAIFLELTELFEELSELLPSLEDSPEDSEVLKKLFRVIHTIKGNFSMLELENIVKLTHSFEDVLGKLRDKKIKITESDIDVFYQIESILRNAFEKAKQNEKVEVNVDRYLRILNEIGEESKEGGKEDIVSLTQERFLKTESIRINLKDIDELMNLFGELYLNNSFHNYRFTRLINFLENKGYIHTTEIENSKQNRELETHIDELEESLHLVNRVLEDFQEVLLGIRMIPVATLFNRFPRMIKELARKLNKKINVKLEGTDTLIDRRVLEQASDSLLHLVRNAVDHGIETPEERKKQGKDETGNIEIKTYPEGGRIVIEIKDDGAGIDIEKVKEKVIKLGWAEKSTLEMMDKQDIIKYIFKPGFSTREFVTEISGRGVGMDVVLEKVQNLKGEIQVDTEKGKGTSFKIILPVTLSIIDALGVEIDGQEYLFIQDDVDFTLKPEINEIKLLNNRWVVEFEGKLIPIVPLKSILNPDIKEIEIKSDILNLVILREGEKLGGIIVDKLAGLKSIILKSTGTHIKSHRYFQGATIGSTGEVVLVLNKQKIFERFPYVKFNLKLPEKVK